MGLESLEIISRALVPPVLRSFNRLNQDFSTNFQESGLKSIKGCLISILFEALGDSAKREIVRALCSDYRYNPVKFFESVALIETTAAFDYYDKATGFVQRKGDVYLGIHIGSIPNCSSKTDLNRIKKGLGSASCYMKTCREKLPISNLVVGLTYEKMAVISRRYGFQVTEAPLPPQIINRFMQASKRLPIGSYDTSNPRFCFQTYDDFLARFCS